MSKHTPGPWIVGKTGSTIFSREDHILAITKPVWPVRAAGGHIEEELSNARLIAAAPEMYEALKWTVAVCEELLRDGDQSEGLRLKKARAILNKLEVSNGNG